MAPAELEALLLEHPGIIDAAVIGVVDEYVGELPKALVVKRHKYNLTPEDVVQYVQGMNQSMENFLGFKKNM